MSKIYKIDNTHDYCYSNYIKIDCPFQKKYKNYNDKTTSSSNKGKYQCLHIKNKKRSIL
jgi:hypothetical protein